MTVLLYLPIVLVVTIYCLYYYFTRTFNYWKKRNVAGPEPLPFFGNLKDSTLRKKTMGVLFKELYDGFPNEKVIGIYRMTTPCLVIRDPDVIKHIMIKDFDNFFDRGVEFSKEGLGANLFHADGNSWRILRNRFTPLFTSGKLKNMLHLMIERGDKFVEYLHNLCVKSPEQEVHSLVQMYTMATISACAFGLDVEFLNDKIDAIKKIDKIIFTPNYAIELDMMYPGLLKKLNRSLFPKELSNFFYGLVESVMAQRNGSPTNRHDFIDLLLELKVQGEIQGNKRRQDEEKKVLELTEGVIAAQAFVFYAAGFETSATTMGFLLYQLALNREIQDNLIAEIDEVLKKYDGQVTYECLKEMTYLGKVFDETLRMYPLVDPLQRSSHTNHKLPGTDVTVEKGQTVLIPVLGIHRDEKYYPNPDKFDPERFSSENIKERHPCAYIPFGIGPRNCIGMRFAQVQSRVCIVKMLSKYRVEVSKNTKKFLEYEPRRTVLGAKGGIYLNIVPRNRS